MEKEFVWSNKSSSSDIVPIDQYPAAESLSFRQSSVYMRKLIFCVQSSGFGSFVRSMTYHADQQLHCILMKSVGSV